MRKWFNMVNVAGLTPEIYIYGFIGQVVDDPNQCVTFNDFQKEFRQLENGNTACNVRINSNGGSVYEGLAIYDLLTTSRLKITTIVDGVAASMAGILVQAGSTRLIAANGSFMIHRAQGAVSGDATRIRQYSDQVQECNNRIQAILINKTGLSQTQIDALMPVGVDTWINAQDAVTKYNLADAILQTTDYFDEYDMKPKITNILVQHPERASWGFMDWSKNDPKGLEALEKTNPQAWNTLYTNLTNSLVNKGVLSRDNYIHISPAAVVNLPVQHPERANWTFMDWSKNDPKGLEALENANPQVWNKLYADLKDSLRKKGIINY